MLFKDKVLEANMETFEDLNTKVLFATAEIKWEFYVLLRHDFANALARIYA